MDPKQLAPVLSNVTASADKLAACPTVKEALAAILRDEKITLADQIAITEVEAPPFHEDERAKDLISHLDMAEIRASAPVPLGEIDRAVVSG